MTDRINETPQTLPDRAISPKPALQRIANMPPFFA